MNLPDIKQYRSGDPIGLITTDLLMERYRAKCRYCKWTLDGTPDEPLGDHLKAHFIEEHQ